MPEMDPMSGPTLPSPLAAAAPAIPAPPPVPDACTGILRLVLFDLAGSRCAFPLEAVERVVPMVAVQPVPGAPRVVLGAIDLAGRVVPVVDLRRRLDLPARDYGPDARLLIVRTPRRTLAVPADDVTDVAEVDRRDVTPTATVLPGLGQVTGIVALPGSLLFIHDLEALLLPDEEHELARALGQGLG
jgi:purine-binding chemotaxis protein CheW